MNPLVPTAFDGVLTIAAMIALALSLAAFVSVLRAKALSGLQAVAWALVVLLVPLLGAGAWFAVRRHERRKVLEQHRHA